MQKSGQLYHTHIIATKEIISYTYEKLPQVTPWKLSLLIKDNHTKPSQMRPYASIKMIQFNRCFRKGDGSSRD